MLFAVMFNSVETKKNMSMGIMKFMSRKRSLILLMSLSVIFLLAAVTSLCYLVPDPNLNLTEVERILRGSVDQATGDSRPEFVPHPPKRERVIPGIGLTWLYPDSISSYRWLALPLATVGITFMLVGLFLYRKEIISKLYANFL